jgi:hypothetical protein
MVWEKDSDIIGGTAKKITPAEAPRPIKPGVIHGDAQPNILNMFGNHTESQEFEPATSEFNSSALLDEFRIRLERMEERLKELELRDEEKEKELAVLRDNEKTRIAERERQKQHQRRLTIDLSPESDPYAAVVDTDEEPVDIPWPRPIRHPFTPSTVLTPLVIPGQKNTVPVEEPPSMEEKDKVTTKPHDDPPIDQTDDLVPSELPAYVLLVGLGVCVVVARVLFRRIGGGRRG